MQACLARSRLSARTWVRCYASHAQGPAQDSRPLAGIRVLDLSTAVAGPSCAMYLGDYGAEVIKLEVPVKGDDTRVYGPFMKYSDAPEFASHMKGEGAYYCGMNRNKKSITLNLKSPKGLEIAKELAKTSDVVIENHITGRLARMGFGYEQVKEIKPDIVWASITGYGQWGPYKAAPGYDAVVGCEAGLVYATGEPDRLPVRPGNAATDWATGLSASQSVLASLFARQRTGKGKHIDISMFDVQVSTLGILATAWLNGQQEAVRIGTGHTSVAPWGVFPTSDGYLMIGVANDGQFQRLANACGKEEWLSDPEFKSNNDRVANKVRLQQEISDVFKTKTMAEWSKLFEGKFPNGRVNNMQQVFSHVQTEARGLVEEIPHPYLGSVKVVASAPVFDGERMTAYLHPPVLGEHNYEIYGQLGYDAKAVEQLLAEGVI